MEFRALESCGAAGHASSTQGLQYFIARTPSAFHLLPCYVPTSPNTTHARKRSDFLPPSSSLRQLLWISCWSASLGLNHFPPWLSSPWTDLMLLLVSTAVVCLFWIALRVQNVLSHTWDIQFAVVAWFVNWLISPQDDLLGTRHKRSQPTR